TTNTIRGLAVSADERAIATIDSLAGIHVRDRISGDEIRTVQTGELNAHIAVSFSPADPILAWAGVNSAGILDYESGETNIFPLYGGHGFSNAAFSPDGRELAFGAPTNIMILDVATRTPRPFASIDKTLFSFSLAFSPNGSLLASAHDGGALILWDRSNGHK